MTSDIDRTKVQLVGGGPVTDDHREINPATGQQKDYVVLAPEERAKGFVRPVRRKYVHVGPPGPAHPLRDLTDDEQVRYGAFGYVKFEMYLPAQDQLSGKFWTQAELDAVRKGCGAVTEMSLALAETYARDPKFYDGTFCVGCRKHLPLAEFLWDRTDQVVGS